MNAQQYNQIYKEQTSKKKDLKNFKLRVYLKKNTIKTVCIIIIIPIIYT